MTALPTLQPVVLAVFVSLPVVLGSKLFEAKSGCAPVRSCVTLAMFSRRHQPRCDPTLRCRRKHLPQFAVPSKCALASRMCTTERFLGWPPRSSANSSDLGVGRWPARGLCVDPVRIDRL